MSNSTQSNEARFGDALMFIIVLLIVAGMWYHDTVVRERAAEMAAYCAVPATEKFKTKIACYTWREERLQHHTMIVH